jgi:hypothetical protein
MFFSFRYKLAFHHTAPTSFTRTWLPLWTIKFASFATVQCSARSPHSSPWSMPPANSIMCSLAGNFCKLYYQHKQIFIPPKRIPTENDWLIPKIGTMLALEGAQTMTEITDPAEIQGLAALMVCPFMLILDTHSFIDISAMECPHAFAFVAANVK